MFIPRGVKRNHSNAVYSPDAVKRAKSISSQAAPTTNGQKEELVTGMSKKLATNVTDDHTEAQVASDKPLISNVEDEGTSMSVASNSDGDDDQEPIKQRSIDQRLPLDEEPVCVVCGRYGEYINDATDRDVCSIECKHRDIENQSRNPVEQTLYTGFAIPQYSIATNVHAKLTAYHDSPEVSSIHPKAIESIRSAHDIIAQGENIPRPITSFEDCQLDTRLLSNLKEAGIVRPTPIQIQAIPVALAGRDMFASAPTSSGKTISFLIPMITHCQSLAKMYGSSLNSGPLGLILAPTRELCSQIEQIAKKLAMGLPHMKTALLIGGMPVPNQVYRLKQGVQILIATPGRMIEMLNNHGATLKLESIKMVVLDEVDVMFKMGFKEQVGRILNSMADPGIRQTCFYSATWEAEETMRNSCRKHLRNSINIHVGKSKAQSHKYVKQTLMWVEEQSKSKQLMSILRDPKYFEPPVLIFVESKLATELLAQSIRKKCGSNVLAMHGDLSQPERDAVLRQVHQSECDIVVATGVLARGIDLPNVRMVINYDMANTIDEYIHQVGRAMVSHSKAGTKQHTRKQGWAITFINNVSLKVWIKYMGRIIKFSPQEHRYLFRGLVHSLMREYQGEITPLPKQLKAIL